MQEAVLLQTVEVAAIDRPGCRLSFAVSTHEIVAILFPENATKTPLLRTFAGAIAPRSGHVRLADGAHIEWVATASALEDVSLSQLDLVVINGALDSLDPATARNHWTRLAAMREMGAGVIVGTARLEHAYRSDVVIMALWEWDDVRGELVNVQRRMSHLVTLLVGSSKGESASRVACVRELRLLARASQQLIAEARLLARTPSDDLIARDLAAEIASVTVDPSVLDALDSGQRWEDAC